MPVLNRLGQAAMGIDGQLSVDGRLITTGVQGRAWLNDTEILTSRSEGAAALIAVNSTTGTTRPIDPTGGNVFYAGANVWVAGLAQPFHGAPAGYRDSRGHTHPEWWPLAVDDRSGTVAILQNRFAGTDLALWDGTTLRPLLPGPVAPGAVSFKQGRFATPCPDGHIRSWTLEGALTTLPYIPTLQAALLAGAYGAGWCAVVDALVAYEQGRTEGLLLSGDGHDFNADAMLSADGTTLIVVSSYGAGERAHELRRYAIPVATAPTWTTSLLVPVPIPPIPPIPPDPPIPPIPPRPPVAFPMELLMSSEGAFVVDKKRLVLNTKADIDPNDPGAGVFVQPHCYHMRHNDGGFVSIGPDAQGNWTVAPTGAKYVSSRENFQWDGSDRCLINCGPPTQVRGFAVMNPT